jgi:Tfp pilus assembly protein PilV
MRRSGVTLIEVTIASILVGTILAASMRTAGSVFRFRSQSSDTSRAAFLADDLLNEILALTYIDPDETATFGSEPSESWSRSVQVSYVLRTDPSQTSGTDQSLKRVTVTVRKDGIVKATADALKVDF